MLRQAFRVAAVSIISLSMVDAMRPYFSVAQPLERQLAQQQKQGVAPLSPRDLSALSGILALNICYLTEQNVSYKPAALSAAAALNALIRDVYGGKVQGIPSDVRNPTQLAQWLSLDIQLRAAATCPKSLPSDIVKDAKRIRAELRQPQ